MNALSRASAAQTCSGDASAHSCETEAATLTPSLGGALGLFSWTFNGRIPVFSALATNTGSSTIWFMCVFARKAGTFLLRKKIDTDSEMRSHFYFQLFVRDCYVRLLLTQHLFSL